MLESVTVIVELPLVMVMLPFPTITTELPSCDVTTDAVGSGLLQPELPMGTKISELKLNGRFKNGAASPPSPADGAMLASAGMVIPLSPIFTGSLMY